MKFVYILTLLSIFSIGLIRYSYSVEWKNYTNEHLSTQIPSNWNVTEKVNRFEDPYAPDLTIRNPNNQNQSFSFTDNNYQIASQISQHGFEKAIYLGLDSYKEYSSSRTIIEGPDFSTFKIAGYPTATMITYDYEYGE